MLDTDSDPPFRRTAIALAPRDGDIAVTLDPSSVHRYLVAQVPGPTQMILATRADALELAMTLARLRSVDVWYVAHGDQRLIESFRPPDGP